MIANNNKDNNIFMLSYALLIPFVHLKIDLDVI